MVHSVKIICLSLGLMAAALPFQGAAAEVQANVDIVSVESLSTDDHLAILDLYSRYGYYTDQVEAESYAALFVPDGELRFSTPGSAPTSVKGRAALAQAIRGWGKEMEPGKARLHLMLNPILIKVSDNKARGLVTVITGAIDTKVSYGANFTGAGMYYDDLVKVDGRWFFSRRDATTLYSRPMASEFLKRPAQ